MVGRGTFLPLLILLILIIGPGGFLRPFPEWQQAAAASSAGGLAHPAGALAPREVEVAFANLPPFSGMVHLTHAGDGTNRLWLVLQPERILVFPNLPGVFSTKVFLDIQSKVNSEGSEEGLLGLAFDPSYKTNGYFYVYYSAANPRRSVLSRFSVSATDPDLADPQSELVLMEIPQPFNNHNGGALAFGPDGYLYVSLGDGGSGGDPLGHGQNKATLLGSILRIDVHNVTPQEPYRIPPDNPFVGAGDGSRPEIWAYGFRNPWKMSFDQATGTLWAGDVGEISFEEVDIIKKGQNYGWNLMEGAQCFPPGVQSCDQSGLTLPIVVYPTSQGCAVIGGHVYRGSRIPQLVGVYIYADFCAGLVWGVRYDGNAVTEHGLLADTNLMIPSFGIDEQGELYILTYNGNGQIYQFVASPLQTPTPTPTTIPTATPTPTPLPAVTGWGLGALAVLLVMLLLGVDWRARAA